MFSRTRAFIACICFVSLAVAACGGEDTTGSMRGAAARSGFPGAGFGAYAGNGTGPIANAGSPGFDLGRPGLVPMAMAAGSSGGSGCLDAVVLFVIDGSGSMCETFGNATRWTALRGALLAPMTGLVRRMEAEAQFGLMVYDGSIDPQAAASATMASPSPMCAGFGGFGNNECPRLSQVPPRFMNANAINQTFPDREPGGSTPTDKAMNMAVDQMVASAMGKDPKASPHFIILATDGQPNDICQGGMGGDGSAQKMAVIAAVDRAAAAGIKTLVISLAGSDMLLEQHLAEVAKHGDPANPAAHTFSPMTPEDLQNTLRGVLSDALGCII